MLDRYKTVHTSDRDQSKTIVYLRITNFTVWIVVYSSYHHKKKLAIL